MDTATVCHLCKKPLGDDRVANHDHLNGEFLGAAHNVCNINYRVPQHIPVVFHNLRGYDCHHLIQGFGKFKKEKMTCIARTSERYISVTLESLRFIDSLQFLNSSLEKLTNNLVADGPDRFKVLHQCMGTGANTELLLRKGVYPYTWMTGPEKMDETRLPPKDAFHNDLTDRDITDEEYQHAKNVWTAFGMEKMRDYHDLYLQTDVLLLADIFENFRTISLQYYGLDPCNFYSSPGLAWQAMLKMTGVQLELFTDIDMHLFIEEGIRGGVAMIPHRFAAANNPYLEGYNPSEQSNYLLYLDCNNLYGTAMSLPLPQSDFRWLTRDQMDAVDFATVPLDGETGYILEVDLEYPRELHDLHSDYPLAPERRTVRWGMLSPFTRRLCDELNIRPTKVEKLLTTLDDKDNYVLHFRALQLYLQLGLKLKTVRRVLAFKQSAWLAPFISFNTSKRQEARNNVEKDYFKLMNNATFGKSMENVRSRIDFKLVASKKQLTKWTASPRLTNFFPFTKDLAGLTLKRASTLLNKPIYVGLTVLDTSKTIMYGFHYKWAVRKYGKDIQLCMTDTDSLFYNIKTEDVYEDIRQDIQLFDTSDYPTTHPLYSVANKKVLGKFKDELNGVPAKEIAGLRAKCYSILKDKKAEKIVAKGVPRVAIVNTLRHQLYKDCLFDHVRTIATALTIQSSRHTIFTRESTKLALSPYDDKRYVLGDGVRTLPYGHYSIPTATKRRHDGDNEGEPPAKRTTDLDILASLLDNDDTPMPLDDD